MGDIVTIAIGPRRGLLRGTRATEWYERGCASEASDPQSAMHCYRRALAGRPDLADAHNNLGRLIHDGHRDAAMPELASALALAEAHYRLAICARPDVGLYWFNLGVSVEDQGRTSEAIACYERAIALDAQLADAHFNLARLYELVGRRTTDELALRRAVKHLVRYRDLGRVG